MGWGTTFTTDVFLDRQIFEDVQGVETAVAECEEDLQDIEKEIAMYGAANLNDVVPQDWTDSKVNWIKNRISALLQDYKQTQIRLTKLKYYLDYLTEHGITTINTEHD